MLNNAQYVRFFPFAQYVSPFSYRFPAFCFEKCVPAISPCSQPFLHYSSSFHPLPSSFSRRSCEYFHGCLPSPFSSFPSPSFWPSIFMLCLTCSLLQFHPVLTRLKGNPPVLVLFSFVFPPILFSFVFLVFCWSFFWPEV